LKGNLLHYSANIAANRGECGPLLLVVRPAFFHEFQQIRRTFPLPDKWPKSVALPHLVQDSMDVHLLTGLLVGSTTIDYLLQNYAEGVDVAALRGWAAARNGGQWQQLRGNPQKLLNNCNSNTKDLSNHKIIKLGLSKI